MGKPYVYGRADDLGIPVVDAKERVFVAVTANDVINAKKADSRHCALARAALRLPGVNAAYFFRSRAFLEYADKMVKFTLPSSVEKEIVSFDRAQIFAPGAYQLSPIEPSMRKRKRSVYNKAYKSGRRTSTRRDTTPRERAGLREAIAKVAAAESRPPVTKEERQFEREMKRIEAVTNPTKAKPVKAERHSMTSGAVKKAAPMPLHPSGPKTFHRRSQYVRDLHDPGEP